MSIQQNTAVYLRNNEPDAGALLAELADSIRGCSDDVDLYLDHAEDEVFSSFKSSTPESSMQTVALPDRFWETLGIRRLMFDRYHSKSAIPNHWNVGIDGNVLVNWDRIRNDTIADGLRTLLSGCSIIEFSDWAEMNDASGFWDRLYADVIKPLNRRDFQFIFRLGDTSKKLVFEVDEVLDILGDYSSYGTVTLVLHEDEADKLLSRLNGQDPGGLVSGFGSQASKEKYLFLFNTLSIDVLLILHGNHAMVFSRDWQFDLASGRLDSIHAPLYTVDSFTAGYQLGLLLHLQIPHCIALGLAVSEVYTDETPGQDSKALLAYLNDWVTELLPHGALKDEFLTFSQRSVVSHAT
jgi:hypothetical protein